MRNPQRPEAGDFSEEATRRQSGFATEMWLFLRHNKKWWLTPIVAILLVLGALMVLGGTPLAPFIYTLF